MSLQLDTGNFKQAWIDGKKVNELWFRGERIYDSTKFYAYGNKWSGSSITNIWGSAKKYVRPYNNTTKMYRACVGNTSSSDRKPAVFQANRELKLDQFTEIQEFENNYIERLKKVMGVESLTQCNAVYYVTQFRNDTYLGDIFVKPFIRTTSFKYDSNTLGSSIYGIGTEYADSTPNDFCWTYEEAYKGTAIRKIFQLTDEQITKIESSDTTTFLCMPYKTNSDTSASMATMYYGGYLLFEVV